jgi:hypothetical protein
MGCYSLCLGVVPVSRCCVRQVNNRLGKVEGCNLERRQSPTPTLLFIHFHSYTPPLHPLHFCLFQHARIHLLRVSSTRPPSSPLAARFVYPHGGATSECNCKSRLQPRSPNSRHAFCVSFSLFVRAHSLTSRILVYKHHDLEMCCPCDDIAPINA